MRGQEHRVLQYVSTPRPDDLNSVRSPEDVEYALWELTIIHSNRQAPATATRQLDFAFASERLAKDVRVSAMNDPDHWGPSDHCRIEIEVECSA